MTRLMQAEACRKASEICTKVVSGAQSRCPYGIREHPFLGVCWQFLEYGFCGRDYIWKENKADWSGVLDRYCCTGEVTESLPEI